MDGIAKKSILRKQVSLLPNREKATLCNLIKQFIFSHNIRQSNLEQHNIPMNKENKYFQRWMIFLSLLIQILLDYFEGPLKKMGSMVEDLLNANFIPRKKERSVNDNGIGLSFLGHLDRRIELNKDIKHGDGRYYPALSIMASKLAYENQLLIQSVVNRHWKMEFVKFYDFYNEFQKKTTTQAFIMYERNTKGDKIIVAFRGTSPFDADDWSTDFDFSWCKIDGMGKTHMGFMIALGLQKYYHEDDSDKLGDYYGYFRKQIEQDPQRPLAYYTIRDKLKEIIANNKRAQIIVTGHSLGGALAILFPAILALHEEVELLDKLEAIYTYGQPRVGNEQFGEFMNNNLKEHNIKYYRIVYGFDCVPSVPLDNTLMTFKHFGTCIHFNSLYQGKILEEEHQKLVKETRNEPFFMMKYLRLLRGILLTLMNFIIARLIAIWELVRGFFIGFIAGPYYKEGWLLLAFRTIGILFPGAANHNPQDYVNATMLTSENIFKYHL